MTLSDREEKKLHSRLRREVNRLKAIWPSPLAFRMKELASQGSGGNEGIVGFLDSFATFLGCILISLYINEPDNKFPHKNLNRGILHFLKHGERVPASPVGP